MAFPPLRIAGVPEHFNLPWRLTLRNGGFEAAGLSVEYQENPGGTGALTRALRQEELDVAIVLTEGIVADIVKGNPSKIVSVYVQSPLIWGIHVAANSAIQSVEEIRGTRYAISRLGSGSQLMAIVDAVQRGWSPKEMHFELIHNLEGAYQALPAGQADVFFWEKFMTQPAVDKGIFRRIGEILTPWPCFMIAAREAVIRERTDELRKLISVVQASCAALAQNEQAASLIAEEFGLKPENVAVWLTHTRWNTAFDLPEAPFQAAVEALQRAGVLPEQEYAIADLLHPLGV